jgi:hypothetical protein
MGKQWLPSQQQAKAAAFCYTAALLLTLCAICLAAMCLFLPRFISVGSAMFLFAYLPCLFTLPFVSFCLPSLSYSRKLPAGWENALPSYTPEDKGLATRQYSQIMLNALAPVLPGLIGGSADLAPSNLTLMKMFGDFQKGSYEERNVRCVEVVASARGCCCRSCAAEA